jgi:uncharacterized membrane protein YgcG
MSQLGRLSPLRHAAVGATVVAISAAGLFGLVGEHHPERFEAKQVVIAPAGDDGLLVREVVDQDFGTTDRHGYERLIPNDFGIPEDISASSPDAPDDVSVAQILGQTRVRIGDPNQTVTGQHRYELTYVYPDARLSAGELALDVIGTAETLETGRFEVVVTGLELADPQCNVGSAGTSGGCELTQDGAVYRAVISPLEPGQGITIGGTITGRTEIVDVPAPPLPARRDDPNRVPLAAAMAGLGTATAVGIYAWSRRRGRNEVYAGGAADAAYGPRAAPAPGAPWPPPAAPGASPGAGATPSGIRLVADEDLGDLATTEFVPPAGVAPWQGAVALRERIDNDTVGAWFSGLAAEDILDLTKSDGDLILRRGPRFGQASAEDRPRLTRLFAEGDEIELGTYDRAFAAAWADVKKEQQDMIRTSGWWKRLPPGASGCGGMSVVPMVIFAGVWVMVWGGSAALSAGGFVKTPAAALALAALVPAIAAFLAYRSMLPARSAEGSAVALRTESFRRFLAASEGRHVEWAWKHGVLREYSAWAVALGAADAWERALAQSSVPPAEYVGTGPLLVYSMGSSFGRSYTAPSSSGGSGGGGFSGGSVGGGGGGGSSGSW